MYARSITKDELKELPLLRYTGKIKLIEDSNDIDRVIDHCSEFKVIGFDTETKPTFRRGQYHPVALIQLALPDLVYLIRINKTGLKNRIVDFLENEQITKLGIGLRDDIMDLKKMKEFEPGAFLDLNEFAEEMELESVGVRKLSGIFLNSRVSKSQQVSNWENPELTAAQQTYAATDAWICLEIYKKMLEWKNS